jgi:hypothetical protein
MIAPVLFGFVVVTVLFVVPVWTSWRARNTCWGDSRRMSHRRNIPRDMDAVSDDRSRGAAAISSMIAPE